MSKEGLDEALKSVNDMMVNDKTKQEVLDRLTRYVGRHMDARLEPYYCDSETYSKFVAVFIVSLLPSIEEALDAAKEEIKNE